MPTTYDVCMIVAGKKKHTQELVTVVRGFPDRKSAAEKASSLAQLTGAAYAVKEVKPQMFYDTTIRPM